MQFIKSILSASALLLGSSLAVPLGITVTSSNNLNFATSTNLNTGIYRDGGGGACVNGLCVAGFSDTTICNGPFQTSGATALSQFCKAEGGSLGFNSFAHNTFATFTQSYAGYTNKPPTMLTDYGKHNGANGQLTGPVLGPITDQEKAMGSTFAIWPNGNMVSLPAANGANGVGSNDVIGVFNALNAGDTTTMYNTMAKITVTDQVADGQTMPGSRIVTALFQENENLYGTYSVMAGHGGDSNLYLFARSGSGLGPSYIKVARVPQSAITDKSKYQYWDGSSWSTIQPAVSDTKSNIISSQNIMDTGEIFWSNHFNCYIHVTSALGKFQIAYSDGITGPWSGFQDLYQGQVPASLQDGQAYMYGGHAYPDWDVTGKSLLLSWSVGVMWIQMATVTFA